MNKLAKNNPNAVGQKAQLRKARFPRKVAVGVEDSTTVSQKTATADKGGLTAAFDAATERLSITSWAHQLLRDEYTFQILWWFSHETVRLMAEVSTLADFDSATSKEIKECLRVLRRFPRIYGECFDGFGGDLDHSIPDKEHKLYPCAIQLFLILDETTCALVTEGDRAVAQEQKSRLKLSVDRLVELCVEFALLAEHLDVRTIARLEQMQRRSS